MIFNLAACKTQGDGEVKHDLNSQSDSEEKFKKDTSQPTAISKSPASKEFSIYEEPSYEDIHRQEENRIDAFNKAVASPVFPSSDNMLSKYELRQTVDPVYIDSLKTFSSELATASLIGQTGNAMISPISVQMALVMVAAGAEGDTQSLLLQTPFGLVRKYTSRRSILIQQQSSFED